MSDLPKTITTEEWNQAREGELADVLLIDIREQDEWDEGHLPGAVHIPMGVLPLKIEEVVESKETRFIVQCRSGGRAGRAAKALRDAGYENVQSMKGGWLDWSVMSNRSAE